MSSTLSKPIATVLVTGASQGLGRSTARTLLAMGCRVIGFARSADGLASVAKDLDPQQQKCFIPVQGDMTSEADLDRLVSTVKEQGDGQLDGLIHNAGILGEIQRLDSIPVDEWKRVFDVNVFSVFSLTQRTLPLLRQSRGRLVMVSSGAATYAYTGWGAYCASKAALNMLVQSIGTEEPHVVAVSIRPGVIDTPMQNIIRETGKKSMKSDDHDRFIRLKESGDIVSPDTVAPVLANLAVRAAPALSGQFLSWNDEALSTYRL